MPVCFYNFNIPELPGTWVGRIGDIRYQTTRTNYELFQPFGVTVTKDGRIWVCDTVLNRIMVYNETTGKQHTTTTTTTITTTGKREQ